MRQKDIWSVSLYDLKCKKRFRRRMLIGVACIEAILVLWFIIWIGLNRLYGQLENAAVSENSLLGYAAVNDGELEGPTVLDALEDYPDQFTGEYFVWDEVDIPEYLNREDWLFVNMKYAALVCDGKTWQGVNDYSYDFDKVSGQEYREGQYTVPLKLAVLKADLSEQWIGENDLKEYERTYTDSYENGMLAGRSAVGKDEVVISDYILDKFQISDEDHTSLIGKKISVYCDGEALFEGKTLVGISDSRLFYMSGLKDFPQVVLGVSGGELSDWLVTVVQIRLPITSYSDSCELWYALLKGSYGNYNFSGVYTVQALDTVDTTGSVALGILKTFGVFVLSTLFLGMVCMMANDVGSRKFFCGMLRLCGMLPREICLVHFYEILLIWSSGFLIGTAGAFAVFGFIQELLYRIMSISERVPAGCYMESGLLGGLTGVILFSGTELVLVFRNLKKNEIRELGDA